MIACGTHRCARAVPSQFQRTRTRAVKRFQLRAVEVLKGLKVESAASGEAVDLVSAVQVPPGSRVVVAFLTHWADLGPIEFVQQLRDKALPALTQAGVKVVTIGLGSAQSARRFAELSAFPWPLSDLYADPNGATYKALGFSRGLAADVPISGYIKLLPMLAGIGSPGTVQEVLRGYVGDRNAKPIFAAGTQLGDAFGAVLGSGYQRPLELATLRLVNMATVLSNWADLAPNDDALLTQQGGVLILDGNTLVWRHDDTGILCYADVDKLLAAALPQAMLPASV